MKTQNFKRFKMKKKQISITLTHIRIYIQRTRNIIQAKCSETLIIENEKKNISNQKTICRTSV